MYAFPFLITTTAGLRIFAGNFSEFSVFPLEHHENFGKIDSEHLSRLEVRAERGVQKRKAG